MIILIINTFAQISTNSQNSTFVNVSYKKLCSPNFIDDFTGKNISFRVIFLGEFTSTNIYDLSYGININNKIFINHRDTSYVSEQTNFGSSDNQMPCFSLSIEKKKSDIIYELKKGDIIEIHGFAEKSEKKFQDNNGTIYSSAALEVRIIEINKINK